MRCSEAFAVYDGCPNSGDPAIDCPNDKVLAALTVGNLSDRQLRELEGILDRCGCCRERLDAMLGDVVPESFQVSSYAQLAEESRDAGNATTASLPDSRRQLPQQIGPFRVLDLLGEGGFGTVYQAEQREPVRRVVAVKVLKAGMDSREVLARFEVERQALAVMDHPSIVHILDAGQTDSGRPYFAMELVRGQPITEYCDRQRLNLRQRLQLFILVCRAVQHAHQKGVIHRDIKPSNVLVTIVDSQPIPKIIDFGIAKAIARPLTEQTLYTSQGQLIGTPEYMSPEQADTTGLDVDTRTDVYSLGVLLYELLVGTLPFEMKKRRTADFAEFRQVIWGQDPPKPSTRLSAIGKSAIEIAKSRKADPEALRRQIRGDLDWITLKCLEKDRTRRYETVNGLAVELNRYLTDEPVLAGPPSLSYRVMKFVRKHRVGVTAACLVFAALVLGLVGTTWTMLWAMHAEQKASANASLADERLKAVEAARDEADRRAIEADWRSYIANIAAARYSLAEDRSILEIRRHLEACPQQLCNWEWDWLMSESRYAAVLLLGHTSPVLDARYSPDGTRIITASIDGTGRVWSADLGSEELCLAGHDGPVHTASFNSDGTSIVTASSDGTVGVWDAASGKRIGFLNHEDSVNCASFSRDGQQIISASDDGTVRIWHSKSGSEVVVFDDFTSPVRFAAFSPDNTRMVSVSDDDGVEIWNIESRQCTTTMSRNSRWTNSAAFSPNGKRIITVSDERAASVFDAESGEFIDQVGRHAKPLRSAEYNHDGTMVVTASNDGTAVVWDTETGATISRLSAHFRAVTCASFSPDSRRLVTASDDGTVRQVWCVERGVEAMVLGSPTDGPTAERIGRFREPPAAGSPPPPARLPPLFGPPPGPIGGPGFGLGPPGLHEPHRSPRDFSGRPREAPNGDLFMQGGGAIQAVFSPDSQSVAIALNNHSAQIWDVSTGELAAILDRHSGPVLAVAFSADGARIVTGSEDKTARLWDTVAAEQIGVLRGHASAVTSVAFSPDATCIATSSGSTLRIWAKDGFDQISVLKGHTDEIVETAFSHDGARIVTGSMDGMARVWDVQSRELVCTLAEHSGPVMHVEFSPDGRRVLTGSRDNTVRMWDASTGKQLRVIYAHSDWVTTAKFSFDGSRLVTASNDGTARLWDTSTGEDLAVLRGHVGRVRDASFSPDGTRLVTASEDGIAYLWDTDSGDQVAELPQHMGWVSAAKFSPDGSRVVTMTERGTVRVWGDRPWESRRWRWFGRDQDNR